VAKSGPKKKIDKGRPFKKKVLQESPSGKFYLDFISLSRTSW